MGMALVMQIFGLKPNTEPFLRGQGITKVVSIHPEHDRNVCTKIHGIKSNSCCNISVWFDRIFTISKF